MKLRRGSMKPKRKPKQKPYHKNLDKAKDIMTAALAECEKLGVEVCHSGVDERFSSPILSMDTNLEFQMK
jgi:hypothetical protein